MCLQPIFLAEISKPTRFPRSILRKFLEEGRGGEKRFIRFVCFGCEVHGDAVKLTNRAFHLEVYEPFELYAVFHGEFSD